MNSGHNQNKGVFGVAGLVSAGIALAIFALPSSALAEKKVINGIIASVDGLPLTLHDLQEYERTRSPFMPPEARDDHNAFLDALIETRLLELEFETHGIVAGDRDVELYVARLLQQNGQTRDDIVAALAEVDLGWDDYFQRMRLEVQRLALVNTVIRQRVSVSPEDVERAWKSDPRFMDPLKVEIAHIYLSFGSAKTELGRQLVRDKAAEIRDGIGSARSFTAAAKRHSMGPTAEEGGLLGSFRRGSMAPHFERAVEGLRDGQVSAPIETADGIHIVRLQRTLAPSRRPLEEIREDLHTELYDQRLNERFERWASHDLRETHFIEMKLEDLALIVAS